MVLKIIKMQTNDKTSIYLIHRELICCHREDYGFFPLILIKSSQVLNAIAGELWHVGYWKKVTHCDDNIFEF